MYLNPFSRDEYFDVIKNTIIHIMVADTFLSGVQINGDINNQLNGMMLIRLLAQVVNQVYI